MSSSDDPRPGDPRFSPTPVGQGPTPSRRYTVHSYQCGACKSWLHTPIKAQPGSPYRCHLCRTPVSFKFSDWRPTELRTVEFCAATGTMSTYPLPGDDKC